MTSIKRSNFLHFQTVLTTCEILISETTVILSGSLISKTIKNPHCKTEPRIRNWSFTWLIKNKRINKMWKSVGEKWERNVKEVDQVMKTRICVCIYIYTSNKRKKENQILTSSKKERKEERTDRHWLVIALQEEKRREGNRERDRASRFLLSLSFYVPRASVSEGWLCESRGVAPLLQHYAFFTGLKMRRKAMIKIKKLQIFIIFYFIYSFLSLINKLL